ncbi:hypothetical protein M0R04_14015 [Candidatus Dojkabacteria bacterium]|jgi:hypothetical protein|nr:hypothetical protein [Candidatus Dojkabacteria bacterium]
MSSSKNKVKKEETVEMYELWIPCKKGEGSAITQDGKNMKMVAQIVNGMVLYLEKDFYLEKRHLFKKEVELYEKQS